MKQYGNENIFKSIDLRKLMFHNEIKIELSGISLKYLKLNALYVKKTYIIHFGVEFKINIYNN
jgi:hypothetical protein